MPNLAVTSVVVGVASLILAIIAWRRPRTPRRPKTPAFDESLGSPEQNRRFVEFLSRNEGRRVRIVVTLPEGAASVGNGPWLASKTFTLDTGAPGPGAQTGVWEFNLRVEDVKDSPLTYAHGTWTLRGHFAVDAVAGVWQGVVVPNLVPIPLVEVAE
jgi:hypothetical protein